VGVHRKGICLDHIAFGIHDLCFRHLCTVFGFNDDLLTQTRLLVGVHTVGHIFNQVFIMELTGNLADDNGVEGVPFADHVTLLHSVAILEVQFRTVGDIGGSEHHVGVGIHDAHFGKTADYNLHILSVDALLVGLHGTELLEFEFTVVA